ncbi:MAG: PAS domain S-box protein [Salinibacterium sp.]|nr:PAS domain S-box protein [Salinibacterium sp.]
MGIVQLDTTGGLLTANDQWLALSGLTLVQSQGSGWAAAMHPDDTERVGSEWAVHAADGTACQTSLRFRAPNGQVNWVQVHSAPTYDNGVLVGHLASVTDVTALRLAEQRVTAMQARFEAAFASSPLGTAIVTLDGRVLEGNRRLFELTGAPASVLNKPVEDIFCVIEEPDATPSPFRAEQHARQRPERQIRCSEGEEIWVNVSIAEIHEGELATGLLYQLKDVTARRLAEARVEHQAFRIFDRDHVDLRSGHRIEGGVQGRRFARPGRPGHEDHAVGLGVGRLEGVVVVVEQ